MITGLCEPLARGAGVDEASLLRRFGEHKFKARAVPEAPPHSTAAESAPPCM